MNEPTQEYLRECFDYIDGKLYWKERPRHHFSSDRSCKSTNTQSSGKEAGNDHYYKNIKSYYRVIRLKGKLYKRSRLIYIMFFGNISKGLQIDHIDGNTLNDNIENLRSVTSRLNCYNKRKQSNNTSGVTGVSYNTASRKWEATCSIGGKMKRLYYGCDFFEAVCARKSWESKQKQITERHGK